MRTIKALLCLSALAGGIATSVAQSSNVYSLNIVGYVNVPVPGSLTAMNVQLKTGSNRADQVIPYSDGDAIQIWSGVNWVLYTMDSGAGTGWADGGGSDVALVDLPLLTPGKLFFYTKNTAITQVTLVGEVPTGTNTLALAAGLSAAGSMVPYGGLLATGPMACPIADGDAIQTWGGASWILTTRDSGAGTGWADGGGGDVAEPTINVGQGFFFNNNTGSSYNWTQILNP